ncbi:Transcriptional regulator PadR-like family protein [Lachnospiraceae bacterium XBB2008]|nr:Transcriptional regulator PadR-like family protein [Lachnospiraceae bacterium XBB2008]
MSNNIAGKDLPLTEAVFYILLSLRHPNHGYGIIQETEELTGGRVVLGAGTLYGAIQTLEKKGWISVYSEEAGSRKKKEYLITDAGREVFAAERDRINELAGNARKMDEEV